MSAVRRDTGALIVADDASEIILRQHRLERMRTVRVCACACTCACAVRACLRVCMRVCVCICESSAPYLAPLSTATGDRKPCAAEGKIALQEPSRLLRCHLSSAPQISHTSKHARVSAVSCVTTAAPENTGPGTRTLRRTHRACQTQDLRTAA